jgi:sugar phosphate permease
MRLAPNAKRSVGGMSVRSFARMPQGRRRRSRPERSRVGQMKIIQKLRWKMLVLMLCGTIVIYIDRNVLGVLAPILKKELDFTTEQYSYVVSTFQIVY